MHRASDVQKSANSQFFTMRLILGQCAYCRRSAMRLLSLFGYREFKDRLNPQTPTHQTVISFRSEPALKTSNCGQPASISLLLIQDFAGHAKILKSLRNPTINADDVDDCADFVLGDTVGDRATTVGLSLIHI